MVSRLASGNARTAEILAIQISTRPIGLEPRTPRKLIYHALQQGHRYAMLWLASKVIQASASAAERLEVRSSVVFQDLQLRG